MVANNRFDGLLNEYKGNFFEYLVALEFARAQNLEQDFLSNLNDSYYQMLEQQESFLRNYFPYLLQELPKLAVFAVSEYKKCYIEKYDHILLAGKSLGASHDDRFHEADILLRNKSEITPISLKLAKSSSFVNTKSGGVKSFFIKYFESEFAINAQKNFYEFFEREYERFAFNLHDKRDLLYDGNFKIWEESGYPVLPGELVDFEREALLEFYMKVNEELFITLSALLKKAPRAFNQGLNLISGNSGANLVHMTCFYSLKNEGFVNSRIEIKRNEDGFVCRELKKNKGSVDIQTNGKTIQVRLKPMNKFTNKSFKINCAIK